MSGDLTARINETLARAEPHLQQCGACDGGLPMNCTHPTDDYRPVLLEATRAAEALRAVLALHYVLTRDCEAGPKGSCWACGEDWPCPTVRAIAIALGQRP